MRARFRTGSVLAGSSGQAAARASSGWSRPGDGRRRNRARRSHHPSRHWPRTWHALHRAPQREAQIVVVAALAGKRVAGVGVAVDLDPGGVAPARSWSPRPRCVVRAASAPTGLRRRTRDRSWRRRCRGGASVSAGAAVWARATPNGTQRGRHNVCKPNRPSSSDDVMPRCVRALQRRNGSNRYQERRPK